MAKILTFDLGTTYLKAALFDQEGQLSGLARLPAPVDHPQPGWSQIVPERFRQTIRDAVNRLRADSAGSLSDVAAVSFATQTNSFLLLDAADAPLTPIILWSDERALGLDETVQALAAIAGFYAATGVPVFNHLFMAAKLLHLRRTEPRLWLSARRLCLISDYLTLWLTGWHMTEAGTAGLTGLVDVRRLSWWPPLCEKLELPERWLPQVARAGTDLGPIRPEAAAELGLPEACRFVVGCLDQYAGAIGAGNVAPGSVSETTGTVLSLVRCSEGFAEAASNDVFQGPAFRENPFWQMVFGNRSANLLEAYRNSLPDRPPFETLSELAARTPIGAGGLRIKPDAVPADVAGMFLGSGSDDRGRAVRAILEAVAVALAAYVDQLCGDARPLEIRSVGGAARSRPWLQIKADVLNLPVAATLCPEGTSLGAALLAAQGLGWGQVPDLARCWVRTAEAQRPDPQAHSQYQRLRQETP
jgi:xylulokinase